MKHRARAAAQRVLPAGFLHLARDARDRADRRADGVRADARTSEPGGRFLDRPGAHLAVPPVDRTGRRGAAVRAAHARWRGSSVRGRLGRSAGASSRLVVAVISLCVYSIGRTRDGARFRAAPSLFPPEPGSFVVRNVWIGLMRQRPGAALLLRRAPVAPQRRAARRCARARAAGAHPPALPLQQHEHHRRAHPQQPARAPRARCRISPTCSAPA